MTKKVTYIKLLHQLQKKMEEKKIEGKLPVKKEQFEILLSGVPAVLNHYSLLEIELGEKINLENIRKHLNDTFKVHDKNSAIRFINAFLNNNTQKKYELFLSFWQDKPQLNIDELGEEERSVFEIYMGFAKQFYPFLKEKGFAAFDYGESVRLARECYVTGILDYDTVQIMLNDIGTRAFRTFDSWEEYAISYLCGGCFFIFQSTKMNNSEASNMFQTVLHAIEELFFKSQSDVWNRYSWLEGKKYFPSIKETRKLTENKLGCFVTDRISINEEKIGYMVREEPSKDNPDSGWRFFAGDESKEYIEDLNNTQVFSLNTVCNYDADIIPFLEEPVGTIIMRNQEGKLCKVKEKK